MPIQRMSVDTYSAQYQHSHLDIQNPPWPKIEAVLRSMDRFAKPNLWLFEDRDMPDGNCLAVCGGNGVYHVQVADADGNWTEAFDPHGSNEIVEVWESDQGFDTQAKKTWSLETTEKLVRWYFENGTRHPGYSWG